MVEGRTRTLLRLGAPLLLAILELGHPRGAAADLDALVPIAGWWLLLHILQLPLFALVAWALADSMHGIVDTSASISRWALLVFALSATLMDSVAGIGSGLLARNPAQASPEQRAFDAEYLRTLLSGPLIGTHLSVVDLVVGSAWLIGLCSAAWGLSFETRSALVLGLLLVSGLALSYGGHAAPFGPIAFGCVFLALALRQRIGGATDLRSANQSMARTEFR